VRIAFVYDAVYPWVKGGAEKRVYEIGRRLAKRGHDVHWFGLRWWGGERDRELDGIHLHGVGAPRELYVNGRRSISEGVLFGMSTLTGLKGEFDVIDCQEFPYFSCFSAKVRSAIGGAPLVITWHEVWKEYWMRYLGWRGIFGKWAELLTARLTSHNIAVSHRTRDDLHEVGVRGVEVIPNGIELEHIRRIAPSESASDIIFAGRLIRDKNVDVLLGAVHILKKYMPNVVCLIVGDGPERKRLEALARGLGISGNVRFMGTLDSHDEVIAHMKSSRVFVLPSTREGFGIVALEANACGLPVVTVKHKLNAACDIACGLLCELSPESMAQKILEGMERGGELAGLCVESAKRYDWEAITTQLERYYGEIA